MLSNPALQKDLEAEVAALDEPFKEEEEQVENLPTLNAVIKVTLRLYGAAPAALPRMTPPEGFTFGKYFIPGIPQWRRKLGACTETKHPPSPENFGHSRRLGDLASRDEVDNNSTWSVMFGGCTARSGATELALLGCRDAFVRLEGSMPISQRLQVIAMLNAAEDIVAMPFLREPVVNVCIPRQLAMSVVYNLDSALAISLGQLMASTALLRSVMCTSGATVSAFLGVALTFRPSDFLAESLPHRPHQLLSCHSSWV